MSGTIELIAFFILATIGIFSALVVVTGKNMFHNVLFFGLFLLNIAGLYLILGGDFLAMAQIFGYVGGIVVLILFAVMLTQRITESEAEVTLKTGIAPFVVTVLFLGTIFYLFKRTIFPVGSEVAHKTSVSAIGKLLLSSHVLPFEVAAIVLLAAIVGALAIVQEDREQ
jgi:NADH:ubiquinone oxidoreductase subunit 6 (subunit J)